MGESLNFIIFKVWTERNGITLCQREQQAKKIGKDDLWLIIRKIWTWRKEKLWRA